MLLWSLPVSASDFRGFLTIFVGFPTIIFCNVLVGMLFAYRTAGVGRIWSRGFIVIWLIAVPLLLYFGFLISWFPRERHALSLAVALLAVISIFLTVTFCLVYSPWAMARRNRLVLVTSWGVAGLAVLLTGVLVFDFAALAQRGSQSWPFIGAYLLLFGIVVWCHTLIVRTYQPE
jgi:hypothetical protein